MPVADYNIRWEYLSTEHETKDKELREILTIYSEDKPMKYMAYAVLGTYGVGKTQFLYHIHQLAIEEGVIPLYFLAEDLFREVITENRTWTPGVIYSLIEDKISKIKEALSTNKALEMQDILDPRRKIRKDSPEVIERVLEKISKKVLENPKIILLLDELEGQYGNLQKIVQTKDRSPLREWLETKSHLKFLAFAPAGIYELGGADRDRVKRIILPPADVGYIRGKLINDAGKSNSCWWLSRGKARQIFKCVDILNKLEDTYDESRVSRIIKQELDSIGQPPTEVPPAVTDKIPPSKIIFLFKLSPMAGEKRRRYVIDTEKLTTGEFAEKLIEAFKIGKDNAMLISEYFKKTLCALSDYKWVTFIEEDDLPELFCLVLDHFLEYEHGDPELSKTFGEILSLYEKSKKESAAIYGIIGRLWELKETEFKLPLSIKEIREAFPFPTMNPIVKNYVPEEMKKRWIGRELPVWNWKEGLITVLFFVSTKDLKAYSETDEFLSLCLPDGNGTLCLLPPDEEIKEEEKSPLLKWLEENDKLRIIRLQPLLTDFLLSASGEISNVPGDFNEIMTVFRENKEDILLSRKSEIYGKAINDIVKDELPRPKTYCSETPPDAATTWGKGQITDRDVSVSGIALAFSKLKPEERNILIELRELFKGGREGSGEGDLHAYLPSKGGYSTLADDILPRQSKKKELKDAEIIARMRGHWRENEKRNLENLARILPLEKFLKLHSDEDINRLLEALWRVTRGKFEVEETDTLIDDLKKDIIPTLKQCEELEKLVKDFGLSGIDFRDHEQLVKSLPSFEKLLEILDKSVNISPTTKKIIALLTKNLEGLDDDIRDLSNLCNNAKRALEDMKESAENLEKNFAEYKKATKFIGISKKDLTGIIDKQLKIEDTRDLEKIEEEANERKEWLDTVSARLAELEGKLNQLQDTLSQIKGEV